MTRLRRSDLDGDGYRRVRAGKGFSYRDPAGELVTDRSERQRFDDLAIPPAWTDVWISPFENGHILATGVDAAGRRQYIYHPSWRERMDHAKFDRALALAEALPAARRAVTADLGHPTPDRPRALAAAFRMLDQGSLRVGSERYASEHGSRGLSTLLVSHATVHGDVVELDFPGKSGKDWSSTIRGAELAGAIRSLRRRAPTAPLLAYKDGSRRWVALNAEDINDYVKIRLGAEFTAKDFRTLHGTIEAAIDLARTGPASSVAERKAAIVHAVNAASDILGNTPAIARRSYVDPRLIDAYEHGKTIDPARLKSAESELVALLAHA